MERLPIYLEANMNKDQCSGAAVFLCFIMDLFTISGKESFTTSEIITIIDIVGKRELPPGLIDRIKEEFVDDES